MLRARVVPHIGRSGVVTTAALAGLAAAGWLGGAPAAAAILGAAALALAFRIAWEAGCAVRTLCESASRELSPDPAGASRPEESTGREYQSSAAWDAANPRSTPPAA
jgi:hypothetical protein